MPTSVTVQNVRSTNYYDKTFEFLGNINNAKVKKSVSYLGDGDIGTTDKGTNYGLVIANLSYNASTKKVRLSLKYEVREGGYNANVKKSNLDSLYFDAVQEYDVSDFFNSGRYTRVTNGGATKIESTPIASALSGTYKECYFATVFNGKKHGFNQASDNLPGSGSRTQPWFPISTCYMKIDDSGNELTSEGNIGIKGRIKFTIERTDQIKTTTTTPDVSSQTPQGLKMGNESKLTSIPEKVVAVLCRGYDISGGYADVDSCRDRVLDVNLLNNYKRMVQMPYNGSESDHYEGEGIQEYTSSIEKKLNIKLSFNVKGFSFTNETNNSFKEDTFSKAGYKYVTQKDLYVKDAYKVQGYNTPQDLTGFLTQEFKNDLNNLSADQLVVKYGTHVVLGMKFGTRFCYNLSFRQSSQKRSTATSFSSASNISYKKDGGTESKDNPSGKAGSTVADIYNDLTSGKLSPKALEAFAKYLSVAKSTSPDQAAQKAKEGVPLNSGSLTTLYQESTVKTSLQEDKSTDVKCTGRGGNAQLLQLITRNNDLSQYSAWATSANDSNYEFADFVPGTLIPLYELVPAGFRITAAQVSAAAERYLLDKKRGLVEYKKGVKVVWIDTLGAGNTENVNKENDGDEEISTQDGKKVFWRARVELVNFDNGHCGYAISFMVKEGGRNAGGRSILLNHVTNDIALESGCSSVSIDTERLGGVSVFESESEWTGKYHGWKEATSDMQTGGIKNVFDCDANIVEIYLDDKGSDKGHVGIRGYLRIPWIGY